MKGGDGQRQRPRKRGNYWSNDPARADERERTLQRKGGGKGGGSEGGGKWQKGGGSQQWW